MPMIFNLNPIECNQDTQLVTRSGKNYMIMKMATVTCWCYNTDPSSLTTIYVEREQ